MFICDAMVSLPEGEDVSYEASPVCVQGDSSEHGFDIPPFMLFSFLPPTSSEGTNLTLSLLFFLKVLSFNLFREKKKKRDFGQRSQIASGRFSDSLTI